MDSTKNWNDFRPIVVQAYAFHHEHARVDYEGFKNAMVTLYKSLTSCTDHDAKTIGLRVVEHVNSTFKVIQ